VRTPVFLGYMPGREQRQLRLQFPHLLLSQRGAEYKTVPLLADTLGRIEVSGQADALQIPESKRIACIRYRTIGAVYLTHRFSHFGLDWFDGLDSGEVRCPGDSNEHAPNRRVSMGARFGGNL